MRTPISRVRLETEYAVTPYNPRHASNRAIAANESVSVAINRSPIEVERDLLVEAEHALKCQARITPRPAPGEYLPRGSTLACVMCSSIALAKCDRGNGFTGVPAGSGSRCRNGRKNVVYAGSRASWYFASPTMPTISKLEATRAVQIGKPEVTADRVAVGEELRAKVSLTTATRVDAGVSRSSMVRPRSNGVPIVSK
jgi:hypothetical protein